MAHEYTYEPYSWVLVYDLAISEKDPERRQQFLLQARSAMLQRARGLEETHGSDLECAALEDAAAVLADMICKEKRLTDGGALA